MIFNSKSVRVVFDNDSMRWYKVVEGRLLYHREDGPAFVVSNVGYSGSWFWYGVRIKDPIC